MRSEGMECDAVAMSAPSFSLFVTRLLPTRGRPSVQSQDRLFPCATVTILPRHCQPQQRESHHDQSAGAGPRNESPAGPPAAREPQTLFRAVGHVRPRFHQASGHGGVDRAVRSEEHTSELQSLMRISYAVFCLKKKNTTS